jgi:hypothetical protein
VLETLFGGSGRKGQPARCEVVVDERPWHPDLRALRIAAGQLSSGQLVAFGIPLNGTALSRALTLLALPFRVRRAERALRLAGARIVGRFGVDPDLDAPSCVYELDTAAAEYADRCLRPRGRGAALRRALGRWCGCDPALGAIVIVGRKR